MNNQLEQNWVIRLFAGSLKLIYVYSIVIQLRANQILDKQKQYFFNLKSKRDSNFWMPRTPIHINRN